MDFLQDEINNNILGTKYNIHILNNNYAGYVQVWDMSLPLPCHRIFAPMLKSTEIF